MDRYMKAPITKDDAAGLLAGDYVYLTGTIYTARDAAHKRMQETLDRGQELPFEISGSMIYYMGPSLQEKDDPSDRQVLRQPAAWTGIRRSFSIWGLAA